MVVQDEKSARADTETETGLQVDVTGSKRAEIVVKTWMTTFAVTGVPGAQQVLVTADRAQLAITRAQQILDIDDIDVQFASARLLGMVHI